MKYKLNFVNNYIFKMHLLTEDDMQLEGSRKVVKYF